MAHTHLPLLLLLLLSLLPHSLPTSVSLVGVNYGRVATSLPSPSSLPSLLSSIDVGRLRIYDADPSVLRALSHTGLDLTVSLPDRCIPSLASDPSSALPWLRSHLLPFLPSTKISTLLVGNEVLTSNHSSLARSLLPAMDALHSALLSLSLPSPVAVTTAHSLAVLSTPSYPPSLASFRPDLLPLVCQLIAFHARTGSPFLVNAYPYFAYADDPRGVDLAFALLDPSAAGFTDPGTGLRYRNLLHAQVDAVYHAIAGATGGRARVEVRVSETGWPSAGDPGEKGASPENAARYNGNLMRLVRENKGTPLAPGAELRVYVFALFNEDLKPGPASERNYGLFKPDGTPAYDLGIAFPGVNASRGGGGHGSGSGGGYGGGGQSMDGGDDGAAGYYSISDAMRMQGRMASALAMIGVVGISLIVFAASG